MIYDGDQFLKGALYRTKGNYKKNYRSFVSYLCKSRIPCLKRNGFYLAILQMRVIDEVNHIEKSILEDNKEKSALLAEGKDTADVDDRLHVNKSTRRILLTIMDGVVARNLKFDRPILRVMCENKQSGTLQKQEYDNILVSKKLLLSFGLDGIRIVSDITRYLRIGDLIQITAEGKIRIYEAKTKKGVTTLRDVQAVFNTIKSEQLPKNQPKRLMVAQMAIINRRISIPVEVSSVHDKYKERIGIEIVDIDFRIKHHLKLVKTLLKKSEKDIVTFDSPEDGYFISVLNCGTLTTQNAAQNLDKLKAITPDWAKSRNGEVFRVNSFDTFYNEDNEFPRNILPYSVYPFPVKTCIKLMTGELYVTVFFDSNILKKRLEASGWIVTEGNYFEQVRDIENYEKKRRDNDNMFSSQDPALFQISKLAPNGKIYQSCILSTQVLNMMFSFYSIDFLVDYANKQFEDANGIARNIAHNFVDEKNIFI